MTLPLGHFVGLVDASGSGGVRIGQSDAWSLVFHLAAWHQPGGGVVRQGLRCELPVAKGELQALMGTVNAYSIVETEATSSANGVVKLRRVAPAAATYPELESIAQELQRPIELMSALGRLRYERAYGRYVGRAAWSGKEVKINLHCADPAHTNSVLQVASSLFNAQSEWSRRVQEFAVEKLLRLKNEAWISEGEERVSAEDFRSRMTLTSITIEETGRFTFWHHDGDLFWGHAIQVSGDITNGPTRADIPG